MAKFRSAGSHYGRTEQARKTQRSNLIPGGNIYQREKVIEARIDCLWEVIAIPDLQWIFERYVNDRYFGDVPKKELKDESYLDNWWGGLDLEDKKTIYKNVMRLMIPEEKKHYSKKIEKCLKKKLKNEL